MDEWMDGTFTPTQTGFVRGVVCWVQSWPLCVICRFALNYAVAECKLVFSWSLLFFCLFSEDSLERFHLCSPPCLSSHAASSLLDWGWNYFKRSHCPHTFGRRFEKWDHEDLFYSLHNLHFWMRSIGTVHFYAVLFCTYSMFSSVCFRSFCSLFFCDLKALNRVGLPLFWLSSLLAVHWYC